jgi:hypothetical protein
LLHLTNDLLDITKIESEKIEIGETTFDVRVLFEDIFQRALHQVVDENAESALKDICEPFTQADASTTRKYGGTGFGLSICNQLVILMQGEFTVTSELGKGSSFTFDLPMLPVEPDAELTPVAIVKKTDRNLDKVRILMVEDSAINAEIFLSLLEDMQVSLDLAENGKVAVHLIAGNEYDLVLMDCQMPVMDGSSHGWLRGH